MQELGIGRRVLTLKGGARRSSGFNRRSPATTREALLGFIVLGWKPSYLRRSVFGLFVRKDDFNANLA
jgi:hypothetical protein